MRLNTWIPTLQDCPGMLILRVVKALRGILWVLRQAAKIHTAVARRVPGLLISSLRCLHVLGWDWIVPTIP